MSSLSVAIATFNEEDNIERCLSSVVDWVGEIVLVDGSSKDKTVEIARKYKAKILLTDNPRIFHINKQKAIEMCKGDWILQLDADEVVTEKLREEIVEVTTHQSLITNHKQMNGYFMPRKNYFLGRFLTKGGQYPDYTLRLYKKGKGRLPCRDVHEQAEVKGEIGYLKNALLHYPYANFWEYLEHFGRYTDLFAREYKESGLSFSAGSFINYMFVKPVIWFLLTFFRHKGFMDGYPGFVFSFFSSLRFPVSFIKYLKIK